MKPEIDEIVDGNDHAQQRLSTIENKEVFSYHLQKFHNGDKDSLENSQVYDDGMG